MPASTNNLAARSLRSQERLPLRVANFVEQSIIDRGLSPGMKLPGERAMCSEFAVSRTVLREAVRILEARGIVKVMPARGIFVQAGGLQNAIDAVTTHLRREALSLEELVEARRFLERHIGATAAAKRTDRDLAILRQDIIALENAHEDPDAFIEEDLKFHLHMADAAGNRLFNLWLEPIMDNIRATRRNVVVVRAARERIVQCHKAILAALETADASAVQAAIDHHLDQFVADTKWFKTFGYDKP